MTMLDILPPTETKNCEKNKSLTLISPAFVLVFFFYPSPPLLLIIKVQPKPQKPIMSVKLAIAEYLNVERPFQTSLYYSSMGPVDFIGLVVARSVPDYRDREWRDFFRRLTRDGERYSRLEICEYASLLHEDPARFDEWLPADYEVTKIMGGEDEPDGWVIDAEARLKMDFAMFERVASQIRNKIDNPLTDASLRRALAYHASEGTYRVDGRPITLKMAAHIAAAHEESFLLTPWDVCGKPARYAHTTVGFERPSRGADFWLEFEDGERDKCYLSLQQDCRRMKAVTETHYLYVLETVGHLFGEVLYDTRTTGRRAWPPERGAVLSDLAAVDRVVRLLESKPYVPQPPAPLDRKPMRPVDPFMDRERHLRHSENFAMDIALTFLQELSGHLSSSSSCEWK